MSVWGNLLFQQALDFLDAPRSVHTEEENALICMLLARRGEFLYSLGRVAEAEAVLEEARLQAEELGFAAELENALRTQGVIAYYQGEYLQARDLLHRALALADAADNQHHRAYTFMTAGALALGNYAEAERLERESLALYEALDYQFGVVHTLRFLGTIALRQGEPMRR